ncbi:zinc finger BED domain-containing protein RICESLEEPER 2-like protein, partial [Tanacetum coccineum]
SSEARDEDYFAKALLDYEVEFRIPFTLRHCWEVLRHSLKWWEQEVPRFGGTKNDAKRSKTFWSSSFNTEYEDANINLNVDARDDDEDDVQELQRLIGRDKAKGLKKKGAGSSGSSSSMNDEVLDRLMVSELATQTESAMAIKKEERAAFLEINRREVVCRERELEIQKYKQRQKDISDIEVDDEAALKWMMRRDDQYFRSKREGSGRAKAWCQAMARD